MTKLPIIIVGVLLLAGCNLSSPTPEVTPAPTVPTETKTEILDGISYANDEYGFSLTLPKAWEGYTVNKREFELSIGLVPSLDFGFKDQESVFNVSMYTLAQWETIVKEEGPLPAEIGKNAKYVFAYSPAQDAANETMSERLNEVSDIVDTFKAS
jgi:hypothetical protein